MAGRTPNSCEPEPRGVRRLPRGATTSGKATLFSEERHACEDSSSLAWVERATSSRYHRGIPTYSQLSQISPGASASVFLTAGRKAICSTCVGPTPRGQFVPKRSARRSHQPLFPRRNWANRCLPVRLSPSTHERARTGCLSRFLRLSVWSGFIRSLRGQAEAKNLAMISPGSNGPLTRSRGRIPTAARRAAHRPRRGL